MDLRRTIATIATTVAVGLLAACGDSQEAATEPGPTDEAVLAIIEAGVDVADAGTGDVFRAGQDGEEVVTDDQVRTSSSGFAEVNWTTGALARVGPDSLYRVVELSGDPARPDVQVRLDVGRAWNRLDQGAIATYEVETAVGTAAVRGTAFDVACTDECTVGLLEGGVAFTTTLGIEVLLRPFEQVTVNVDGVPGEVVPLVIDDWILDNVRLDEERGQVAPPPGLDGEPVADERPEEQRARLDGEYELTIEFGGDSDPGLQGTRQTRTYSFTPGCDEGPCGGTAVLGGAGNTHAFTWTGGGYALSFVDRDWDQLDACTDAGVPTWREDFVLTITPTQVESVDGALVVTDFTGTWRTRNEPHPDALAVGCNDPGDSIGDGTIIGAVRQGPA